MEMIWCELDVGFRDRVTPQPCEDASGQITRSRRRHPCGDRARPIRAGATPDLNGLPLPVVRVRNPAPARQQEEPVAWSPASASMPEAGGLGSSTCLPRPSSVNAHTVGGHLRLDPVLVAVPHLSLRRASRRRAAGVTVVPAALAVRRARLHRHRRAQNSSSAPSTAPACSGRQMGSPEGRGVCTVVDEVAARRIGEA